MRIITRVEWQARPPKTTPRAITLPTPELWLHHTASPTGYAVRVRAIQDYHMDVRGWNDIAYSYLINHDGDIYEGRGAGIAGGHTAGHNTISHAICVMGNYDLTQPSVAALRSVVELARYGHAEGWWREGFTGGHRDASGASTSCPGGNLWKQLPTLNETIRLGDDMPLTDGDVQKIWFYPIPDMDDMDGTRGAAHALRQAWGFAKQAALDAAVARKMAEQLAQGLTLSPDEITAIADAVADELGFRLGDQ